MQLQYHWTSTDYANLVLAFRLAYSVGMALCGRLMDRIGTRRGASFWLCDVLLCFLHDLAKVLPADLYHNQSVASVSGLSGTGARIGSMIASALIGHDSDARRIAETHSFGPIMIAAGIVPLIGMFLVLLLIRKTRATEEGLVRRIQLGSDRVSREAT